MACFNCWGFLKAALDLKTYKRKHHAESTDPFMFRRCRVAPLNVESADDLRDENRRLSQRLDELERLHADDAQTIARLEAELHALRLYNAIPDVGVKRHDFLASLNEDLEDECAQLLARVEELSAKSALGSIELNSCKRLLAQQNTELNAVIQAKSARLDVLEERLVHLEASCAFHAKQWGALEKLLQCPIGLGVMQSPVIVSTGHCYDRSAIAPWLDAGRGTCPMTRARLTMIGSELCRNVFVLDGVCEIVSQTLLSIQDSQGLTRIEVAVM